MNYLIFIIESARSSRSSRRSRTDELSSEDVPVGEQRTEAPPSQRRRVNEDGASSPNTSQEQHHDQSLQSHTGLLNTSEMDMSSPLNYGTPASSRMGSVARGTPYVCFVCTCLLKYLL